MDAYRKALAINPNHAMAPQGLGLSLYMIGHAEEAIASFDEAARSSPRDPIFWAFLMGKSLAMYCAERHEEALFWAAKARDEPNGEAVVWPLLCEAASFAHLGRIEEARAFAPQINASSWRSAQIMANDLPIRNDQKMGSRGLDRAASSKLAMASSAWPIMQSDRPRPWCALAWFGFMARALR